MEIRVQEQSATDEAAAGGLTLEVELALEDVLTLKEQALEALDIERSLPEAARTEFVSDDDAIYINDFIEKRAAYDALEIRGIVPVAVPRIWSTAGLVEAKPFTCYVNVYPRPSIGLKSLDPVDLATNRIAKPGFSQSAAQSGEDGVEFLDDEKTLRMALTERLDGQLPESAMRALGEEYERNFERELLKRGSDPDTYKATHQIDDEQYSIMMTRRALGDAHWNFALDAVFDGVGLTMGEEDLLASFEAEFPGYSRALLDLHMLRNDLHPRIDMVRRAKALEWLRSNAIR